MKINNRNVEIFRKINSVNTRPPSFDHIELKFLFLHFFLIKKLKFDRLTPGDIAMIESSWNTVCIFLIFDVISIV